MTLGFNYIENSNLSFYKKSTNVIDIISTKSDMNTSKPEQKYEQGFYNSDSK